LIPVRHFVLFKIAAPAPLAALFKAGGKKARASALLIGFLASLAPNALESAAANGDTRTLFLYHSHSKEAIAATFRTGGHYDGATLERLNWFLRDWRTDEPTKMDPRLFDALWEAYRSAGRNTGPDDPIVVVSAYRSPATNAMLRRRSSAVAEHSQHILGKAMDSTMPGMSMERLREIAMRMQRGGVGYYPNANTPFVHIDVGGVRHWPRMNYDQLVRLFPDGKTVHLPSNGHPLPGYEEARAEILARGGEAVSVADANSGGIGGFFARLFGLNGGEDAEEEIRDAAPAAKPTRVARVSPAEQRRNEAAAAAAAEAEQRRLLASAETNLPRGETYMAAPEPARQPAVAPPPQPAPQPAMAEPAARPALTFRPEPAVRQEPAPAAPQAPAAETERPRVEDETAAQEPANVPTPPRRPAQLAALEPPLPPQRPAELAKLPDVITHGSGLALRPSSSESLTLAYASPSPAIASPPLPPPRPASAPLRAAALGKAEEARAARAATQMAPARVDRGALQAMVASTPQAHARPSVSGGLAPALRAAARPDLLAANPPPRALRSQFGQQPTQPDPAAFSK
jgi:uncharacterized protein YcbK (DUF882 family)